MSDFFDELEKKMKNKGTWVEISDDEYQEFIRMDWDEYVINGEMSPYGAAKRIIEEGSKLVFEKGKETLFIETLSELINNHTEIDREAIAYLKSL